MVSRFISDISMAQNFVGSAMINIWMDGVSLGFVIWLLFRGFVDSLSDKLDTLIGEGGVRPSTGQRQRLVLARVFLKNPPILILDEATSGLDSEVENLIHDAVRRLMKGRTSFLIAHRLSSAVGADVIVVLDSGRIVEVGSHLGLVKRAGVYARLFNEQTRKLRLTPEHIVRLPGSLSPAAAGEIASIGSSVGSTGTLPGI